MTFSLVNHVSNHRPSDPDFQRQLDADPIFQEVQEARSDAIKATARSMVSQLLEQRAMDRLEAALAKAKLFESMEDL
ncbi:MAG: hypothetical protein AAFZ74_01970 [Pseudomonadota bacterium]